jgi:hypothetical protein
MEKNNARRLKMKDEIKKRIADVYECSFNYDDTCINKESKNFMKGCPYMMSNECNDFKND